MPYQYPLTLTFKFWSWTPNLRVEDQNKHMLMYVRQKLFRFKEVINVYADEQRSQELYTIKADRIIDFSARYNFSTATGQPLGSVKRRGMKSLWKAHYDIFGASNDQPIFTLQEENPWVKVMDAFFGEIPILGMFTGMVFNPAYIVSRADGTPVMRLEKIPSFWSRLFTIKLVNAMAPEEETEVLLSMLMLLLLESQRG